MFLSHVKRAANRTIHTGCKRQQTKQRWRRVSHHNNTGKRAAAQYPLLFERQRGKWGRDNATARWKISGQGSSLSIDHQRAGWGTPPSQCCRSTRQKSGWGYTTSLSFSEASRLRFNYDLTQSVERQSGAVETMPEFGSPSSMMMASAVEGLRRIIAVLWSLLPRFLHSPPFSTITSLTEFVVFIWNSILESSFLLIFMAFTSFSSTSLSQVGVRWDFRVLNWFNTVAEMGRGDPVLTK
ncbi:hypothetical protein GALMADRAFT_216575 [Galerina marginata CBS 339.88]|uniref:Uncharacterized protein n=1 Tax=Galerina marginata (strain CBS 339.88) TaxID=685588 RepID=A0A067S8X9_GALM3|nr:hypothetical protein GALMADRAFT_216575 [Galerina marginata CBS 339.88]